MKVTFNLELMTFHILMNDLFNLKLSHVCRFERAILIVGLLCQLLPLPIIDNGSVYCGNVVINYIIFL